MDKGSFPVVLNGDGMLMCPHDLAKQRTCSYLRQTTFDITYSKCGGADGSKYIVDRSSLICNLQHPQGQDIANIHFDCVFCGETHKLMIYHHEGSTYMYWK